ncbi:uncharacterized protein LOC134190047 isoform X2 [Corticium candelabrum]|uniref:uncharacterized protein LOC134190047 isoform X2 n=1 Tax=Corticium candelabrum TaxID=121492 RepID=UPI002E26E3D9|nr:uncharacterized protein LOC134190047 isoform X2 [Corticium candelabrum]
MAEDAIAVARPDWDVFLLHRRDERSAAVTAIYRAFRKLNIKTFWEYECVDWGQSPLSAIDAGLHACRVVIALVSRDFFACEKSIRLLDVALELTDCDRRRKLLLVSLDIDVPSDVLVRRTPRLPWTGCLRFSYPSDCNEVARHVQTVLKGLVQDTSPENNLVQNRALVPDIGALFQLLRDEGDNVILVKDTLLLISERALTVDDRKFVLSVKGFEPVVAMLSKYSNDSIIFQHGLAVIARMCYGSVPNKCHAKECCAMTQVVQALRKFENFRDVLQEALACVKNMCLEYEENRKEFVENNGVVLIVRVMRKHKDDLVLQRWTCAALCASFSYSAFAVDQFVGHDGLALLRRALQFVIPGTHSDRDEIIQKWACHAVAQLANIVRVDLLELGVLQQCEITRQQFPQQSPAYEAASHAIHCLLHPDETVSSRRDFLREGGMQMVVQVMNDCRHGNDEEIQRLACQAIREYCCESGNLYGMGCHVIVQWLCV